MTKKLEGALSSALRVDGGDGPKMAAALRRVGDQKRFIPALAEQMGVEPDALASAFHRLAWALDEFEAAASPKDSEDASAPAAAPKEKKTKAPKQAAPQVSPKWGSDPVSEAQIFSDGCSKGNPGKAAGGVVIQSPEGETLFEAAVDFADMTNNEAEYNALIRALEIAAGKGVQRLRVFSDSELVVKQITGKYRVKTPHLVPLVAEVQKLKTRFQKCSFEAVPRARNARADELANYAIDQRRKS